MNRLRAWWGRLRGRFARPAAQPELDVSATPQENMVRADVRRIHDGLDYAQPTLLPGFLRRQLERDGTLAAYLREDARTTLRFQFDTPQRSAEDLPIDPVTDDPLYEWSWATRMKVLSNCHAVFQRNPIAKASVQYTVDFVVGENGFGVTYKNKAVETVLEGFINSPDNQVRAYERQALQDLQVDGEILLRTVTDGGEVVIVPQRPWELREVVLRDGILTRPEQYVFMRQAEQRDMIRSTGQDRTGQEDVIPAEEIIHVAINRHAYELRGRPELFVVLPWLRAYKEWLEDRARQNYWRGALLWWVKVTAKVPGIVASVLARWKKPPTPGSVVVTSDAEEVNALSNTVGAADVAEDGRQIKMMAVTGLRMAEYMLGDGENANLATATAQQLPALTKFSGFQQVMEAQLWRPLFRRVVQAAIDAGNLPPMVVLEDSDGDPVLDGQGREMMLDTLEAFEVNYAPIADADVLKVAQVVALAFDRGWISEETAITEIGHDPQREAKLKAREEAKMADDVRQGLRPMPVQPRANGLDGEPEDEAVSPNGQASA